MAAIVAFIIIMNIKMAIYASFSTTDKGQDVNLQLKFHTSTQSFVTLTPIQMYSKFISNGKKRNIRIKDKGA